MTPSADTMRDLVVVSRVRHSQVEVAHVKEGEDAGTGQWQLGVTGDDDINNNGDVKKQIKENVEDPTATGGQWSDYSVFKWGEVDLEQ